MSSPCPALDAAVQPSEQVLAWLLLCRQWVGGRRPGSAWGQASSGRIGRGAGVGDALPGSAPRACVPARTAAPGGPPSVLGKPAFRVAPVTARPRGPGVLSPLPLAPAGGRCPSRPPPALRTPPVRGNGHGVLARGAPTGCRLRGRGPFLFVTRGPLAPSPPSSPVPCGRCAAHVAAGPVPADTGRPRGPCHSACFVEQKEGMSVSWATCEGLRCRVPRALCAGRTAWAARPRGSGRRHVTPRGSPPNPLPDAVPREGAELGCRAGHPGNTHQHRPSGSGPAGRGRG